MFLRAHLEDAFRLATLRAPRHAIAFSPRMIVFVGVLIIAFDVAAQWLGASETKRFQIYGVNAQLAWIALSFAVIALFAGADAVARRHLMLASAVGALVSLPFLVFPAKSQDSANAPIAMIVGLLIVALWFAIACWRVFQAAGWRTPIRAAAAYCIFSAIVAAALPDWPVFPSDDFSRTTANLWEWVRAESQTPKAGAQAVRDNWRARETKLAEVEAAQPERLEAALAALAPRAKQKTNIYVIGVAGWSDQNVFQRETEQSFEIMKARLGAGGHMLALVNSPTADKRPIASVQNLAAAVRGVAARMNRDNDVLILTMTSHGSDEGFALENEGLVDRTLSPSALKAMLDSAGVRNRVIIVSACYSGIFTGPLGDDSSVVITAAASDRTSFGCANEREWTYFGEAFFDNGLRQKGALVPAFEAAQAIIAKREAQEKLTPSQPQMFVGEAFRRRFPALVGGAAIEPRAAHAAR